MRLAGRTAIVTGAALGIGAAIASLFAPEGARVALVDADAAGLEAVASAIGREGGAAYIASKGAIVALARTMAVDHARQGIRVNVLMPAVIETAMSRRSLTRYADPDATRERWAGRHAMGRFGTPEEVARAALFLASDEPSFTTGSPLLVDGGWTAM